MKSIIILLVILILSGFQKSISQTLQTFTIFESSVEQFVAAKSKYKSAISTDTSKFDGNNKAFKIHLLRKHNSNILFEDSGEEEKTIDYSYEGYIRGLEYHVISVRYYEHYKCLLIDATNGRKTTLWDIPKLSPDGKFLASIMPAGLEGNPIGIQILGIKGNLTFRSIYNQLTVDQMKWSPIEFTWKNNHEIIIKAKRILDLYSLELSKDFLYLKISI